MTKPVPYQRFDLPHELATFLEDVFKHAIEVNVTLELNTSKGFVMYFYREGRDETPGFEEKVCMVRIRAPIIPELRLCIADARLWLDAYLAGKNTAKTCECGGGDPKCKACGGGYASLPPERSA